MYNYSCAFSLASFLRLDVSSHVALLLRAGYQDNVVTFDAGSAAGLEHRFETALMLGKFHILWAHIKMRLKSSRLFDALRTSLRTTLI